jgi:hypothetical protein
MTARRTRLVVAGLAALSLTAVAVPAHAEDTTVTFELTAGVLAIAVPATADLGAVGTSAAASAISGQLGETTVTDGRGALLAIHNVTLTSSNFTTGGAGVNETILGSTVTAMSGPVAHTNTTATAVPVETVVAVPSGTVIEGLSAYNGTDTATYNPTVTIPIPATNAAGAYSGVITQTVLAV